MKKFFDPVTLILIVISVVVFSIETLPSLENSTRNVLVKVEYAIIVVFTIEYLIRLITAKKRIAYFFSFFGLIDLVAILPFYFFFTIDLTTLRVFRLLKILRLLRYNQSIKRFTKALKLIKEDMILFSIVAGILLYLSAVGIYFFEHQAQPETFKSVFHSLWWAVATLTTVGYGDIYPITTGGKIFTFFILMIGLGIISVPAGLLASALSKARK